MAEYYIVLAEDFNLTTGHIEVQVPNVSPSDHYIVGRKSILRRSYRMKDSPSHLHSLHIPERDQFRISGILLQPTVLDLVTSDRKRVLDRYK